MKQWIALLLAVMMVTLAVPVALADDQGSNNGSSNQTDAEIAAQATTGATHGLGLAWGRNNETNETDMDGQTRHEIEAMDNTHGANMRLLELQRELERRILYAQAVMTVINNKTNVSVNDTTQLNGDITTLQTLLDQAKTPVTNTSGSAKQFVDIKHEAEKAISDFRTIARSILSPGDIGSLTSSFEQIDKTQLQAINDQIKQERDALNADRVQTALGAMGVTNSQLVSDVQSGKISAEDAKNMLRDSFGKLKPQDKQKATTALNEQDAKRKVQREMHVAQVKENVDTRRAQLAQKISQKLDNAGFHGMAQNMMQRANQLEQQAQNIEQRIGERMPAWRNGTGNWTNSTRPGMMRVRNGQGNDNGQFQPGEAGGEQ